MRQIQLSTDVFSVGELKVQASRILKMVKEENRAILVTQHGKPAAVVISPADFDRFCETTRFLDQVRQGMYDAQSGRMVDGAAVTVDSIMAVARRKMNETPLDGEG